MWQSNHTSDKATHTAKQALSKELSSVQQKLTEMQCLIEMHHTSWQRAGAQFKLLSQREYEIKTALAKLGWCWSR